MIPIRKEADMKQSSPKLIKAGALFPDSGTRFGAAPLDKRKATWMSIRRYFSYTVLGFMSTVLGVACIWAQATG